MSELVLFIREQNVVFCFAAKKGILRDRREFWGVLEQVERFFPEASDITTSVKEMPNVK